MSTQTRDEGSLKGLGAEILLPPRGNPFEESAEPMPVDVDMLAVGAERAPQAAPPPPTAPSPSPEAAAPPAQPSFEALSPQAPPEAPMPEPRDLSPEDLMALFPSSHAERELPEGSPYGSVPAALATLPAEPATELPPQPPPSIPPPAAAAEMPLAGPVESATAVTFAPPETRAAPTAAAAAATVITPSAPLATVPLPPETPSVSPLAQPSAPAAPAPALAAGAGQAPPGIRGVGSGAEAPALSMEHLASLGPQPEVYTPGDARRANPDLAEMFAPDGKMMTLWLDIEAVEADVISAKGLSSKGAAEMLDRLMKARNFLMNERAQYEEAARQVAEVRFHLAKFRNSNFLQTPQFIAFYLVAFLALLIIAGLAGLNIAWDKIPILGFKMDSLWYTMLFGGLGGFTGAAYSLGRHVARDRDYDPQFALWYFQNPWMGIVLGMVVYLAIILLMNIGSVVMTGQVTSGSLAANLVFFFFAWLVGLKHNTAFDLADWASKKLLPRPEHSAPTPADKPAQPSHQK